MKLADKISRGERPFVVAGPCSAESEQQVMSICKEVAQNSSVKLLRAGIWKPRTRPNSFEGLGEIALPWLVNAGKATNLPTTTEVANKKHVEAALKAGIDVLWIGARTTVNPFAVQEIADALKGIEIPVMIKNPINPDLQLWLGAFERFEQAGITDLTAIHRGFSVYKHAKYRNVPSWQIPIALKEERPDLPIICDPSHITGRRDLLLEVSQKAMDLNFEGLMIETHPNPDEAWSDAAQQVTGDGLKDILSQLVLRSVEVSEDLQGMMKELRTKISVLDDRIFEILGARMELSEEVGQLKRENSLTILQQDHWKQVIDSRIENRGDYRLTQQFVRQLMDAIHQESIRHQTKVMNIKKQSS
ncbi:MAG: bifunctional 3-deoxy-7-phosphoheptulonate synthase/chorismate mutase type II [Crocinitomicaceae bacterium]|nr:bifunctional 3-deoxy-7-phosphoheptulonate synthase/chorismate mutase type II [Flavobacteriales bacterium]NQZ34463.1 bifunctional 3-deoxy-7-phosphoheptulonate synthase/chorismate mutase type II [Crocinitomicaceae bacterium]